jgi:enamine deaminase RidA (YjgF/YER057c/UK114 family)
MTDGKQVIGEPLIIGGRRLSLSRAIRAGDFVFLTGQVPLQDGAPMTGGTIEDQSNAAACRRFRTRRWRGRAYPPA